MIVHKMLTSQQPQKIDIFMFEALFSHWGLKIQGHIPDNVVGVLNNSVQPVQTVKAEVLMVHFAVACNGELALLVPTVMIILKLVVI